MIGKHGKWTVDFDYGWNAVHEDFDAYWDDAEQCWEATQDLQIRGCQTYKDLLMEIAEHERADDFRPIDPSEARLRHISAASGHH